MPKPMSSMSGVTCEIEGRRLVLSRMGSGGPAVVFMPGAGLIGLDFRNIQEAVARFTTAVIYDRAGTGCSDPVALPRSAAAVADELHALLKAAGVPGPYILVGHSLGGAYIRRFAQRHPHDVAGLLFLDPAHEGYLGAPRQSLPAQIAMVAKAAGAMLDARRFYRPRFAAMYRGWPTDLAETLVDYHLRSWRTSLAEAKNLNTQVLGEIRDGGPLPDRPLIVLTAMGLDSFMTPFMDAGFLRRLNAAKAGYYDALAASVPHGENRRLPDAGHSTLHTDRPDAVVQALADLVAASPATAPALRVPVLA